MTSLIEETEREFKASNTARAWKVVNTITNRKKMAAGKLKGKTPEERKEQWLEHFRNLLGTPDTNPPIDDIPPIFDNVSIEDGAFTLKELKDRCQKATTVWEGTRRGWHLARNAEGRGH